MRIILDYIYATQLVGIFTTFALCMCIILFLYLIDRFNVSIKKHFLKGPLFSIIYIISGFLFICIIIQISCNPFSIGRAGTIHQVAILKDTIIFVDSYAQSGAEFGDTPSMLRIWVLDRQTGKLLKRIKADSYEPIVAADDTSLLIHEDCNWYISPHYARKFYWISYLADYPRVTRFSILT